MDATEIEVSGWIAEWARRTPDRLAIRFERAGAELSRAGAAGGTARRRAAPTARAIAAGRPGRVPRPQRARAARPAVRLRAARRDPRPAQRAHAGARARGRARQHRAAARSSPRPSSRRRRARRASASTSRSSRSGPAPSGGLAALLDGAPDVRCDPDRSLRTPLLDHQHLGHDGPAAGRRDHPPGAALQRAERRRRRRHRRRGRGPGQRPAVQHRAHEHPHDARARRRRRGDGPARVRSGRDARGDRAPRDHARDRDARDDEGARVASERWDATDLSSLRCVITGSTTVREDALAPWFDRGVCVLQDYGLTEAMPVVTIVPRDDAYRLRATAGRPVPHCRVRIAADDGAPVEAGEIGEVLVQGPTVMPEYWRNPEATSKAFHDDGWLRTGDAGFLDAEGMLHDRRPHQGRHHRRQLQRVPGRRRVGARELPADRRGRRRRAARRGARRGAGRVRGACRSPAP